VHRMQEVSTEFTEKRASIRAAAPRAAPQAWRAGPACRTTKLSARAAAFHHRMGSTTRPGRKVCATQSLHPHEYPCRECNETTAATASLILPVTATMATLGSSAPPVPRKE
jgi:hypothetical protein